KDQRKAGNRPGSFVCARAGDNASWICCWIVIWRPATPPLPRRSGRRTCGCSISRIRIFSTGYWGGRNHPPICAVSFERLPPTIDLTFSRSLALALLLAVVYGLAIIAVFLTGLPPVACFLVAIALAGFATWQIGERALLCS